MRWELGRGWAGGAAGEIGGMRVRRGATTGGPPRATSATTEGMRVDGGGGGGNTAQHSQGVGVRGVLGIVGWAFVGRLSVHTKVPPRGFGLHYRASVPWLLMYRMAIRDSSSWSPQKTTPTMLRKWSIFNLRSPRQRNRTPESQSVGRMCARRFVAPDACAPAARCAVLTRRSGARCNK